MIGVRCFCVLKAPDFIFLFESKCIVICLDHALRLTLSGGKTESRLLKTNSSSRETGEDSTATAAAVHRCCCKCETKKPHLSLKVIIVR